MRLTFPHEPEEPRLGPGLGNLEGQATAVTVETGLGQFGDAQGCESLKLSCHACEIYYQNDYQKRGGLGWILLELIGRLNF